MAVPGPISSTVDNSYVAWRNRFINHRLQANLFRSPADIHGRSVLALDHAGQPVYGNIDFTNEFSSLPYEMNLVHENRYDSRFEEEDLEGILRSWDENAPVSRIISSITRPPTTTPSLTEYQRRFQLDALKRTIRTAVTTRSFEVPALPFVRPKDFKFEFVYDPIFNVSVLNDGYEPAGGGSGAPVLSWDSSLNAYGQPLTELRTITELFRARLLSNHSDHGGVDQTPGNFLRDMALMLPYELARGQRFDLNRPFGDGIDNDGGGIIDEENDLKTVGGINISGETGDPSSQSLYNILNSHPLLVNIALNGTPAERATVLPAVFPMRQTFARHLYCLMMFLKSPDYVIDFEPLGPDPQDKIKTARAIAQFAVNVVDFRDADVAMTPFEYDVNPYDGWDVTYNMTKDNPTEDLVWGCERPELLITETAAWHDRRTEDLAAGGGKTTDDPPVDKTFDQRLEPHGAFFVELYNPGLSDSVPTDEIYDVDNGGNLGVDLSRVTPDRQSPIWRMIVAYGLGDSFDKFDPDDPDEVFEKEIIERHVYFYDPDDTAAPVRPSTLEGGVEYFPPIGYRIPLVQPGRYAVLGSAGRNTIGRRTGETTDLGNFDYPQTQRIELNTSGFVAVGLDKDNDGDPDPTFPSTLYQPVPIPISEPRSLNISDPPNINGYRTTPFDTTLSDGEVPSYHRSTNLWT